MSNIFVLFGLLEYPEKFNNWFVKTQMHRVNDVIV